MSFKGVRARLLDGQVVAANLAPGSVTPDKLGGTGAIPAGITLALEQLGGGQLPPNIAVALDQLGSGTLPNTIDVAAAAIIGTLVAGQIGAGQVTTEQLSIGAGGTNRVPNPGFEDLDPTGYPATWTQHNGTTYSETSIPRSGARALTCHTATTGDESSAFSAWFPVSGGEVLAMRVAVRVTQNIGRGLFARLLTGPDKTGYPGAAGTAFTDWVSNGGQAADGTHHVYEGTYTVPAAHRWGQVCLYLSGPDVADVYAVWDDVDVRSAITGVQIHDGAIDGKTITGAIVQTAASGTRVQLGGADPSTVGLIPDKVRSTDTTPVAGGLTVGTGLDVQQPLGDVLRLLLSSPVFSSTETPASIELKVDRSGGSTVTIGGTLITGNVQLTGSLQYNVPRLVLSRGSTQALPSGAVTNVTYDNTDQASLPGFTQSGGVVTADSHTGTTLALVTLEVTVNLTLGSSRAFVELVQAGSIARTLRAPFGTGDDHAEVTGVFLLSALDTLTAHAYQATGSGSVTITEAHLTVVKLGQ